MRRIREVVAVRTAGDVVMDENLVEALLKAIEYESMDNGGFGMQGLNFNRRVSARVFELDGTYLVTARDRIMDKEVDARLMLVNRMAAGSDVLEAIAGTDPDDDLVGFAQDFWYVVFEGDGGETVKGYCEGAEEEIWIAKYPENVL